MFELVKGKMRLIAYSKKDADMYVKSGWKLIKDKTRKRKNKNKEIVANNDIDITSENEVITKNVVTEIAEEK